MRKILYFIPRLATSVDPVKKSTALCCNAFRYETLCSTKNKILSNVDHFPAIV